jgi:hypothetical protein
MERPQSITALGILNIAFGLIGIMGSLGTTSMYAAARANPAIEVMRDSVAYNSYLKFMVPLSVVFGFVALAAGVGLLRMLPWARKLSIGYGIWIIVRTVVNGVVTARTLIPAMLAKAAALSGVPSLIVKFTAYGLLFGSVLAFIYPALLIYFMTRPHVKLALAGQAAAPGPS